MANYQTLTYEKSGAVATVTLNRPDRMNGMTSLMVREAHDALAAAADDASVSVLVLTGAGSSFCPGADLRAATAGERDVPADPHHFQVPVLLHEMPAITVAAINGACAGAGFGWACGCDLRVAARSAMFNTAFLNVAVAGDMGLPWSLPRLVGAARARELSFFSEKFSAEEAQRIGLVARVWDDAELPRPGSEAGDSSRRRRAARAQDHEGALSRRGDRRWIRRLRRRSRPPTTCASSRAPTRRRRSARSSRSGPRCSRGARWFPLSAAAPARWLVRCSPSPPLARAPRPARRIGHRCRRRRCASS